jgi:hypothetical protein
MLNSTNIFRGIVMKYWALFLSVFLLAACNTASASEPEQIAEAHPPAHETSDLPDLGEAPELNNEVWLNSPEPLRLADLRGKVVLLEMWTFG